MSRRGGNEFQISISHSRETIPIFTHFHDNTLLFILIYDYSQSFPFRFPSINTFEIISLRFNGYFSTGFIGAKEDVSGGENWSYKRRKPAVRSSPSTNQRSTFYRPDALHVTQPTMSKYRKETFEIICSADGKCVYWNMFRT